MAAWTLRRFWPTSWSIPANIGCRSCEACHTCIRTAFAQHALLVTTSAVSDVAQFKMQMQLSLKAGGAPLQQHSPHQKVFWEVSNLAVLQTCPLQSISSCWQICLRQRQRAIPISDHSHKLLVWLLSRWSEIEGKCMHKMNVGSGIMTYV